MNGAATTPQDLMGGTLAMWDHVPADQPIGQALSERHLTNAGDRTQRLGPLGRSCGHLPGQAPIIFCHEWDVAEYARDCARLQTLKTGRLATAPGTLIEFEHEGGELEVNGVVVRSAVGVSFENSKRYLVAVRFHPDLQKWQVGVMFELNNLGVLRERTRRDGSTPDSALRGVRLAEVADAISKGAK